MRIGVVPSLDRSGGGIYQYSVTLLSALPDALGETDDLIVFLYGGETLPDDLIAPEIPVAEMRAARGLVGAVWYRLASVLPDGVRARVRGALGRTRDARAHDAEDRPVDTGWKAFFEARGVDLLLFTADSDLAFRCGLPYIVAIHDIQHRLQPEFPEVSADGEWERREYRIGNCIRYATGVLVDSAVGKEDILATYAPDEGIVSIVPFVPASYLREHVLPGQIDRVRAEHSLPVRFVFYPAAFWPHKNHLRIVEAIAGLRRDGLDIPTVLVGANGGSALRSDTFTDVMAAARELGVEDLVLYLGYVEDAAMSVLYAEADALVMPTFFGPTNIPVVEAFKFGCPVVTSDIRGIREQVGDAAVLVDPRSAPSIADGIRRVWTEPLLAASLTEAGYAHLAAYSHEDFTARIREALERARPRIAPVGEPR